MIILHYPRNRKFNGVIPINNSQYKYIETLTEHLIPELEVAKVEIGHHMTFMQDNAPCHKSGYCKEFFNRNEIKLLEWPPQSPDLNLIENLWAILKYRRQKKYGMPISKAELIEQVLKLELCQKLSYSVENRLKQCILKNGGQTKY